MRKEDIDLLLKTFRELLESEKDGELDPNDCFILKMGTSITSVGTKKGIANAILNIAEQDKAIKLLLKMVLNTDEEARK